MEEEFKVTIDTYRKLNEINMTKCYTEGVNMRDDEINTRHMNILSTYGINVIGYEDFAYDRLFDSYTTQKEKINLMKENAKRYYNQDINGLVPQQLEYNLDTIRAAVDENLLFMEAIYVPSPVEEFNQEGLRFPRLLHYHGNETSLVLFPVSEPTSSYLRPEYPVENTIAGLRSTVNSVVKNDDSCVFLLRSNQIGRLDYVDWIAEVIEYAKKRGITFTTIKEIAEHFRLIQNISAVVSRDIDSLDILIRNENNIGVDGVTFKFLMPVIGWECPYTARNGRIIRIKKEGMDCKCFVATDLDGKEIKEVSIEPNISRKGFNVVIPDNPIEGLIQIQVKDLDNNSINKALVIIGDRLYETNNKGIIELDLKRGTYIVEIEKPGFRTKIFNLDVGGRIQLIKEITIQDYLLAVFIMIILILLIIALQKNKWVRLEYKKAEEVEKEMLEKLKEVEDRIKYREG